MGTLAGSLSLYCTSISRERASTSKGSQSLQVRDHVGTLFVAQHVRIRGHAVAAGINDGEHVRVGDFLAVLQRGALVEALQSRPDLLFGTIRVMADRALVKYLFTLGRVSALF